MLIKTMGRTVYEIYRENGKKEIKKVSNFYPYFYVKESEKVDKRLEILKVMKCKQLSLFGEKLKKIVVRKPKDIKEIRDSFTKTFEADVLYKNRYLIDSVDHSKHNYEYRVCYIDMEMDNREGFPFPDKAEYPITTITCFDTVLDKYVIFVWREDQKERVVKTKEQSVYYFSTEESMIKMFAKFLRDTWPEVVTGWNVEGFDFQYTINRMTNLGLDPNSLSPYKWAKVNRFRDKVSIVIDGMEVIDLMKVYITFQFIKAFNPSKKLESYSLKAVSEYEEIGSKYKLDEDVSLSNMWIKDLDAAIKYNKHDVKLLVDIENKLKLFNFMDSIKAYAGCELKDTLTNSKVLDHYILKFAKFKEDIVLPTALRIMEEPYKGPFIYVEEVGLVKNVAGLDFKSFYPSIIETFNLSPEVKNTDEKSITVNKLKFSTERVGFCAKIVKELIQERYSWKNAMKKCEFNSADYLVAYDKQTSVKTIVNSFYGVLGYVNFRLYDRDIASTVTYIARRLSRKTKAIVEDSKFKVVYAHTDSAYVKLPDEFSIDECIRESKKLVSVINLDIKLFLEKMGVMNNTIELDFEKFFKSAVFTSAEAKYFALLVYENDKFIDPPVVRITGFEAIKRDTPKKIRKFLKDFYLMILNLKSHNEIRQFIIDEIERIKKGDLIDIAFTMRISKAIDSYKANSQHIRAAKYSNTNLGTYFKRTDYIKMVFIKKVKTGLPATDIVAFDDASKHLIKEKFEIDWERQLKRVLFMKIGEICKTIKMQYEDIEISLRGQKSLNDF